jgi:hypothetical protein
LDKFWVVKTPESVHFSSRTVGFRLTETERFGEQLAQVVVHGERGPGLIERIKMNAAHSGSEQLATLFGGPFDTGALDLGGIM